MSRRHLYHYTALEHLQSIRTSGFIKATESHARRPVVWLTERDYVGGPPPHLVGRSSDSDGRPGPPVDKSAVRFTVNVPSSDAFRYDWWAKRRGVTDRWIQLLERAGGEPASAWWIVPRDIPHSEWIAIEVRDGHGGWKPAP